MPKLTMKLEGTEGMPETKVKGVSTGHIKSVIPTLIRFLQAIGFDTVTDVQVVMTGGRSGLTMTYGKDGRIE